MKWDFYFRKVEMKKQEKKRRRQRKEDWRENKEKEIENYENNRLPDETHNMLGKKERSLTDYRQQMRSGDLLVY